MNETVAITMKKKHCALILGGYVNGYSIIQELYEKGVKDIILFDNSRSLAAYSHKIRKFALVENTPGRLYQELKNLHQEYEKIVVFPTNDLELEQLGTLHDKVKSFCFLPFNNENLLLSLDKYVQYSFCEKLGIPYPKTTGIESVEDIKKIESCQFPVIVKPSKRYDLKMNVFRSLRLNDSKEYQHNFESLRLHVAKGITFFASEIVPGNGSNIYAYVGYRDKNGNILNEWTGKKLAQYPNEFGVFSSASNQASEDVLHLGRILLHGMNLYGICQPEFKYDYRDNKYKLMEINLRSMMWHRVGNLSNVNIQYTQYLDAIGEKVEKQTQEKDKNIHFVYLKFEMVNLFRRKGYLMVFLNNIFNSNKTYFAVFDKRDLKPFLADCIDALKKAVPFLFMNHKEAGAI